MDRRTMLKGLAYLVSAPLFIGGCSSEKSEDRRRGRKISSLQKSMQMSRDPMDTRIGKTYEYEGKSVHLGEPTWEDSLIIQDGDYTIKVRKSTGTVYVKKPSNENPQGYNINNPVTINYAKDLVDEVIDYLQEKQN